MRETIDNAVQDLDTNLDALLQRCAEKGIKLNPDKTENEESTIYWSHSHKRGILCGPIKVAAIVEIPVPANICTAAVQRLLGMAKYLSNFLPHLSQIHNQATQSTDSLTRLERHRVVLRKYTTASI